MLPFITDNILNTKSITRLQTDEGLRNRNYLLKHSVMLSLTYFLMFSPQACDNIAYLWDMRTGSYVQYFEVNILLCTHIHTHIHIHTHKTVYDMI